MSKIVANYTVLADEVNVNVKIVEGEDFVKLYKISIPEVSSATLALLDSIKEALIKETKIGGEELFDQTIIGRLKLEFRNKAESIINKRIPNIEKKTKDFTYKHLKVFERTLNELQFFSNPQDPNPDNIPVKSTANDFLKNPVHKEKK